MSHQSFFEQYIDHLGNIRLTYADSDGDGTIDPSTEIISEKNYYPFGLEHKGYNNTIIGAENNYKTYMGKEHQKELGLETYDFGARNYDPALGRWFGIDELAEDYYSDSPYGFVANNPIMNIEIDGRFWIRNADGTYTAEAGDSASTLYTQYLKDQGYSFEEVDALVQSQHGNNYIDPEDGIEQSNIDPGAVVDIAERIPGDAGEPSLRVVPNDDNFTEGTISEDQVTQHLPEENFEKDKLMMQVEIGKAMLEQSDPRNLGNVLKILKLKGVRTTTQFNPQFKPRSSTPTISPKPSSTSVKPKTNPNTFAKENKIKRQIRKRAKKTLKKRKRQ